MYNVILAWTVYSRTGSAADMGYVMVAYIAPQLIFAVYGGVLADRMSRQQLILLSNLGAGLITLGLCIAIWLNAINAYYLVLGSFLLGLVSAFFTPAYGSIFKDILDPDELRSANALSGTVSGVLRLVSPALGGALYAIGGATIGFGLDSATFFFAALAAALMVMPARAAGAPAKVLAEARLGLSYLVSTRWLRRIVIVSLLANTFCIAPMEVLLALLVRQSHEGSWFLGLALSVQAGVAAAAALGVGRWPGRIRPGKAFYLLSVTLAAGVAVLGLNLGPATIVGGVILIGLGFTFSVIEDTVLQKYVPSEYLGRVYSLGMVAAYSLLPIGYVLAGVLSTRLGPGPVLLTGGLVGILASLLAYLLASVSNSEELVGQAI
jgi:MFS family permease